jgi:hypothetical protein
MNRSEEWRYIYEERLGMLCGRGEASPEQIAIAMRCADRHLRDLGRRGVDLRRQSPPMAGRPSSGAPSEVSRHPKSSPCLRR